MEKEFYKWLKQTGHRVILNAPSEGEGFNCSIENGWLQKKIGKEAANASGKTINEALENLIEKISGREICIGENSTEFIKVIDFLEK